MFRLSTSLYGLPVPHPDLAECGCKARSDELRPDFRAIIHECRRAYQRAHARRRGDHGLRSRTFAGSKYNVRSVTCPLCGQRKARRACPALGRQICAVSCGPKRLVEIQCPSDCVYLAASREHPPVAVVRRQQRDLGLLVHFMRDLNERQSQLFFLTASFLVRYEPPEFHALADDDAADAASALAGTLQPSTRGVIYEHGPAALPAERLMSALKPVLAEAGKNLGTAFERDAAVVLRRIEEAARRARATDSGNPRAFLDLVARVVKPSDSADRDATPLAQDTPRLIVP